MTLWYHVVTSQPKRSTCWVPSAGWLYSSCFSPQKLLFFLQA